MEKQAAREVFLAYKAIKKDHQTENTRFIDRKTHEKKKSRVKAIMRSLKQEKY